MNEICKSLIEWFQTLNLKAAHANAEDLSDGLALAEALHQFVPEFFTDVWLSKIKADAGGSNWRLKLSNLKKVVEGLYDYYGDVLNYSLSDFRKPDAMRIAEKCDVAELQRLLQLVLGCAVNCIKKDDYIHQMMCLEQTLQTNLMQALQELDNTWHESNSTGVTRNSLSMANFNNKTLQEERDQLAQKHFEAEKKMSLMAEENANLRLEVKKLQEELKRIESSAVTIDNDGMSLGPVQTGSVRYNDMRRQLDLLKEELLQSETSREDMRLKGIQQDADIAFLQGRIAELNAANFELTQLKDEVDFLRESNENLKVYQMQVSTLKAKLEDYNDLKKQLKLMEERSADYNQLNAQFEEDVKRCVTLKGQVERYKSELQELHAKLDAEVLKNMKIQYENKKMESTISGLQRTEENLRKERDSLRETIDELKCGQLSTNVEGEQTLDTVLKELEPTALLEKLKRLDLENKALREGQGGQAALMQLLDDANKRSDNLRNELRSAKERIIDLTHSSLDDANDTDSAKDEMTKEMKKLMELNEQKSLQLEESINQNVSLQGKIAQLENTLATREQDWLVLDSKYRKYLEKAKEVIKSTEPRLNDGNLVEQCHETTLMNPLNAKLSTMEENLMTTAFYKLAVSRQREAIDTKLALLMGGQGHSFLTRQRQSMPRKSSNNNGALNTKS